jgi:rusticyanin
VILLLVVIIILLLGYGLDFGMMNGLSGMMGAGMSSGMMNGNYSSMMGGSGTSGMASMMVGMMGQVGTPIAVQTAVQDVKVMQSYAIVSPKNNSISFGSKNVSIVVLAMGVDRAMNLTNSTPPAYAKNDTFVIDGLINPTLVLQKGSTVHITFVNLDSSAYHNIIITSTGPPYQYMPMSAMGGLVSMMSFVQHANYQQGQAYEYSYNASFNSVGTFWYLCMYPGHAQMGMYGKIIVE